MFARFECSQKATYVLALHLARLHFELSIGNDAGKEARRALHIQV